MATGLLAADPATSRRLLPVLVNTGITRVVSGRRGLTLLTLNDHAHLPPEHVTHR
ncbi:MAG: hypothetical protein ACR2JD_04635 [Nocardioides sp.]